MAIDSRVRMGPITRFLVRSFGGRHFPDPGERKAAYGLLGGYVSIVVNTLLAVVKLVIGLAAGSIGVIADAAHTFSDSLTSVVLVVSSYFARQPADEEHPFGHGRAELIGTIVIAVLLGVAGLEFGRAGVERLLSPSPVTASWWVVAALISTIAVKEWMSRFSSALAAASGSTSLEADSWHHRSDAISTGLVVIGVVAAGYGWPQVDALAGIGVALFLIWVAFTVASSAIHPLVGQAPSFEEVTQVKDIAREVAGVRGVHDVVIHQYGDVRFVSLHVETSDSLSSADLHSITHEVERRVGKGRHGSVCVHPAPVNDSHPAYAAVEALIRSLVAGDESLDSFHDLRIVGWGEEINVVIDLKAKPSVLEPDEAVRRVEKGLKEVYPKAALIVELEPPYSY